MPNDGRGTIVGNNINMFNLVHRMKMEDPQAASD